MLAGMEMAAVQRREAVKGWAGALVLAGPESAAEKRREAAKLQEMAVLRHKSFSLSELFNPYRENMRIGFVRQQS